MARDTLYCAGDLAGIVADAVERAIAEHGAPNRFHPGELARHYTRGAFVQAMQVGRVAPMTVEMLRKRGLAVEYRDRAFVVGG